MNNPFRREPIRPKNLLDHCVTFLTGCAAVLLPAFYQASLIHADETARHEQTMSPGIHMFVGMILAPLGGLAAMVVLYLIQRVWKTR